MSVRARRGFALFELLVAVAIFAIMGVIAYRSLAAVTSTRAAIAAEAARLGDAQFAIALLERDLRQAAVRPVRDGFGQPQPALQGTRGRVELTAWAFASPSEEPRALEVSIDVEGLGTLRRVVALVDTGAPLP